ncbi:PACE efflux transporter [Oceanisphaera pacifica]|uniref:PACE efflux transporter n=1 Tax=Oceanisphaera pacifica TaxID=2818389 RepID=A0ABS3NGG8_9GAMM|nr:PACE efflux transporter [Oceanisphaera pacifica]MBO1519635.1 PACE efflux transporter [Oceanisphaera pacifica]
MAREKLLFTLSAVKRRLLYVALFEVFAIILSTFILMVLSDGSADDSLPIAIIISTAAVIWNYIYNALFERWETLANVTKRSLAIRSLHAAGFEGGLFLFCLPLYMLWYGVGLWQAIMMESALLLFFLVFTFVFTLAFDKVFTLPHQMRSAEISQ